MFNDRNQSDYGLHIKRTKTIHAVIALIFVILLISVPFPLIKALKSRAGSEKKDLLQLWENGSFKEAFNLSKSGLASKPMDYFLLTIHGFTAYQLGISQINNFDTLVYIDECIGALRKALLLKDSNNDGRVHYVLGKAYSYKGDTYADLAVKYLEKAKALAYPASDIPEYLGLAYAAMSDYRSSVEAFSLALQPGDPSDLLLLSIARSYIALDELESARAYLLRCIELSRDSKSIMTARLLLGDVLGKTGDDQGAENQFTAILEETGENAEAHYQLGELYTRRGDTTRARAEWRQAVRADPAHAKARTRLNM
jgi:tetratricopeptide (TPR) repeat protein